MKQIFLLGRLTILLLVLSGVCLAEPVISKRPHTIDVEITGVDATPDYSAGDLVAAKLTVVGTREGVFSGEVESVVLTDKEANSANFNLWLFSSDPSSTTFTDNGAFTIADADIEKVMCVIPVTAHVASGSGASVSYQYGTKCAFKLTSTTFYAAIEAEATINAAAADDLHLRLTILED